MEKKRQKGVTCHMRIFTYCVLTGLLLMAGIASAQLAHQVIPPNPTTVDFVIVRYTTSSFSQPVVTRIGNHFRVEFQPCMITCPSLTQDAPLGLLATGSYTYEIAMTGDPTPLASGAFVVTAAVAATPALSSMALFLVCALLAGAGSVVLSQRS